jgi:hypothetical protein
MPTSFPMSNPWVHDENVDEVKLEARVTTPINDLYALVLAGNSQTLQYTPTTNNDTPTSGTATWFTMGSITVPTWATQCVVTYSINGIITLATGINCTAIFKVGSVSGALGSKRISDNGTTAGRFCFTVSDLFTGLSTGSQSVTVSATWQAGTADKYRLDTTSYVTARFDFQP